MSYDGSVNIRLIELSGIYFLQITLKSPVKAFWSVTMYNNKSYFVNNPINRYSIGGLTKGLKYNSDGSLDIYIQPQSPGQAKENNWLPSPGGSSPFKMFLRMYWPDEQVLDGIWPYPQVQRTG